MKHPSEQQGLSSNTYKRHGSSRPGEKVTITVTTTEHQRSSRGSKEHLSALTGRAPWGGLSLIREGRELGGPQQHQ
jgi:hypothetical protein